VAAPIKLRIEFERRRFAMGGLINTIGTGYLSWFYNHEFEENYAFHQANAASYAGNDVWGVINSLYDNNRQRFPLLPTPDPKVYPNLVARWQYFHTQKLLTQTNQALLLKAIHDTLGNKKITEILFGVRLGANQTIDSTTTGTTQIINIVVTGPMPTGRDNAGNALPGGPPPIDRR
jgi:hypothetical protein